MKAYKQGQRIKVEFENAFHGTRAAGIGTIIRFEGGFWVVELPLNTWERIGKKLCPFSDCTCQKVTHAKAIATGKEVLFTINWGIKGDDLRYDYTITSYGAFRM